MFDFDHTCPIIDSGIQALSWPAFFLQDKLESLIDEVADGERNAYDATKQMKAIVESFIKDITSDIEKVRDSNVSMREAAEAQIEALENKETNEKELK